MFCNNCGTQYDMTPIPIGKSKFCRNCGNIIYKNENGTIVFSAVVLQQNNSELERLKQEELLKQRQLEIQQKQQTELEKQKQEELLREQQLQIQLKKNEEYQRQRQLEIQQKQQAETERKRQEELLRQRQLEIENQKADELEKQRQEELLREQQLQIQLKKNEEYERQHQLEIQQKQQAETERKRQEELLRQRQLEIENQKADELEKQRQAELERKKQDEFIQQQFELDKQKVAELEKQRQDEIRKQQDAILEENTRIEKQKELQKQKEAELEAKEQTNSEQENTVDTNEKTKKSKTLYFIIPILLIGILSAVSYFIFPEKIKAFFDSSPIVTDSITTTETSINTEITSNDTILIEQLKADLIGKEVLSWNAIKANEIKELTISSVSEVDKNSSYIVTLKLDDKAGTKATAELVINYTKIILTSVETNKITYKNIAPVNAWFSFEPVSNCSILVNTNNNPIQIKSCENCAAIKMNTNTETQQKLATQPTTIYISSDTKYESEVDFTYIPNK